MENSVLYYTFSLDDIEYNTAVNKKELEREKALLRASVEGNYKKIEQLLKSGVCVNTKKYNKLLFYASRNYLTPLQLTTLYKRDNCIQLLIDYCADVNAKDLFGFTALHLAAFNGAYNILKILLHAKADCSVPIKFSQEVSLKYSANIGHCKIPHLHGTTPLHLAAATNKIDCVKYLIRYGADFNAVDEYGRTSLYIAAQHGYSECVLIHLKEAIGQDILSLPSFKTSDTPLHFAVQFQMIDCIKELLYLGSDVNHRNFEGLSPLHTALLTLSSNMSDRITVLKLLVLEGYKTDINQADSEGFTPLHYASFNYNMWRRRPEMAKFLIAYGANVNIKNHSKCSLLKQELTYPEENFDILKCLVKSLLYLPSLKSLDITLPVITDFREHFDPSILRIPSDDEDDDPYWTGVSLIDPRTFESIENFLETDYIEEIDEIELPEFFSGAPTSIFQPEDNGMQFPYVLDEYEEFNNVFIQENQKVMNLPRNETTPLILKKQLWYQQMASHPRTLKHHCRFLIRNVLGPMKLKYIKQLPIPKILQSFLLFELKE